MRTLACTFLINGTNTKVALRKRGREKKFQIVIRGEVLEYTVNDQDNLEQINGPELADSALLPHIEWMIRHYFTDVKRSV
jgi:translation initiation factor IF-3